MLKTLHEDGFNVTLFERRSGVGGLWAYTEDTNVTSILPGMLWLPKYEKLLSHDL